MSAAIASGRQHPSLSVCIGCGCDDMHACGVACFWLHVDVKAGLGVCSACPEYATRWRRGERTLAPQVVAARAWAASIVARMNWRTRTAFAKLRDGLALDRADVERLERANAIVYLDGYAVPIREVLQAFNRRNYRPQAIGANAS